MRKFLRPTIVGIFVWLGALHAWAELAGYSHDEALAHSQAAIGRSLDALALTHSDGRSVSLADYKGKPLVLSMIFTSCHHICPTTTQNLEEVVQKARTALGEDSFHVVTVGFDTPNDTPERMAQFRRATGVDDANWDFLSADASTMADLAERLGFIYAASPRGFDHLIQASIIDAQGVIYRQVYGISFPTPHLIEPLKELVFGQPQGHSMLDYLGGRIRLFCTVYDPASDSYRIDISVFIGTFVGLMVSIIFGITLVKEWRRSIEAGK